MTAQEHALDRLALVYGRLQVEPRRDGSCWAFALDAHGHARCLILVATDGRVSSANPNAY
jgi:hypothetical protein